MSICSAGGYDQEWRSSQWRIGPQTNDRQATENCSRAQVWTCHVKKRTCLRWVDRWWLCMVTINFHPFLLLNQSGLTFDKGNLGIPKLLCFHLLCYFFIFYLVTFELTEKGHHKISADYIYTENYLWIFSDSIFHSGCFDIWRKNVSQFV